MTDQRKRPPVSAEWARIGKKPGTAADFSILASSHGDLGVPDLSEFSTSFVPGFPGPELDPRSPGAPPWVTFGTHRSGGASFVSVSELSPSEGFFDQTGRPIWSKKFVVFKYDDLIDRDLSFGRMYRSITDVELPHHDGLPLLIDLPPDSQSVLAAGAVINTLGFDRLALLAAALLDGPLAVTGVGDQRLDERLRLMDAIAALLPRGFRWDLTASSAVSGFNVPKMRLILGTDPGESHRTVHLDAPSVVFRSAESAEYYELLRQKKKTCELPEILRHLWAYGDPYAFTPGAASTALAILGELDRESELDRRANDPASIDRRFTLEYCNEPLEYIGRKWETLPPASRHRFLSFLLAGDDEEASRALVRCLLVVLTDLIRLVNSDLDHGTAELALRGLRAVVKSGDAKALNAYLEYVLVSGLDKSAKKSSWPTLIRPRVDLLLVFDIPRPGELAGTRRALRYGSENGWQAQLVRRLLDAELVNEVTEPRARGWALWLFGAAPEDEQAPHWVAALDFIVGNGGTPGAAARAIAEVTRTSLGWVTFLSRMAQLFGCLPDIFEMLRLGLLRCALHGSLRNEVTAVLDLPYRELRVGESDLAWVDSARELIGVGAQHLPDPGRLADRFAEYVHGVEQVLNTLTDEPGPQSRVEERFLGLILRSADAPAPAFPRATVELVKDWSLDPDRAPGLARHILRSKADGPLLANNQLTPEHWERLAKYEPAFKPLVYSGFLQHAVAQAIADHEAALARLTIDFTDAAAVTREGVRSSLLASAVYQTLKSGMAPRQILTIMSGVHVKGPSGDRSFDREIWADELWEVLRDVTSLHRNRAPGGKAGAVHWRPRQAQVADHAWRTFLDQIMDERVLGDDYARQFRDVLIERTKRAREENKWLRRRYKSRPLRDRWRRFRTRRRRGKELDASSPSPRREPARLELTSGDGHQPGSTSHRRPSAKSRIRKVLFGWKSRPLVTITNPDDGKGQGT